MGSELPNKSPLANLPGTGPPVESRTSSCACSNSETCKKTLDHSARNRAHGKGTEGEFGAVRPMLKKPGC